jgi:hypothetical protein
MQIKEQEKQGVQFLCIVEIIRQGRSFRLDASWVNVKSKKKTKTTDTTNNVRNGDEMMRIAQNIVQEFIQSEPELTYKDICIAEGYIWKDDSCWEIIVTNPTPRDICISEGKIWRYNSCYTEQEICISEDKIWKYNFCYTKQEICKLEGNIHTFCPKNNDKLNKQQVDFGWHLAMGLTITPSGSSSEWFGAIYKKYEEMEKAGTSINGGYFATGLMLDIWLNDIIALATELNYSLFTANYCYWGNSFCGNSKDGDYFININMYNHTINIPALLRLQLGEINIGYIEAGLQMGFPLYSSSEIMTGSRFSYSEFEDEESKSFSKFRLGIDWALVLGFGWYVNDKANIGGGLRLIYPLTKLDRYGTLNSPIVIGFTVAIPFY